MPKIRRSDAEWAELIKECKSCGLSDREWMKQHHISSSSFYKKLHELYGDISNVPVAKKRLPEIAETHEIVEIGIGEESNSLQRTAPMSSRKLKFQSPAQKRRIIIAIAQIHPLQCAAKIGTLFSCIFKIASL